MRTITKVSLICIVVTSLAVSAGVPADATDEATREQLVALKKLCDEGLVGPEVCKEKQREILRLAPRALGPPARAFSPSPRGATGPTPSSEDSLGSARPGTDAKQRSLSGAPPQNAAASAERVHESPLGFRMRLSPRWLRAGPQETQRGFALVKDQIGSNPDAKRAWERVSANVEIYLSAGAQMSVQARDGAVPENASDGAAVCQQLSSAIAKLTSRPVTMHECGLRTVAGVPMFYVDHDGVGNGTRTMQFWLEKEPTKLLQFTLNSKDDNVDSRRKELTDIVASVRWP